MRPRPNNLLIVVTFVLVAYVTSYLWLSRRGYAEADRYHSEGFYYFTPENTPAWHRKNFGCVILFWPLNLLDRAIGCGREPAFAPLMDLSDNNCRSHARQSVG